MEEAVKQNISQEAEAEAGVTEARIAKLLFLFDVSPGTKGYSYVLYAIQYKIKNPLAPMKELYLETGKHFGDPSYERVERSLRYAIQKGYYKGNVDFWAKHFRDCPSNSEFLAKVAEILRLGLDE